MNSKLTAGLISGIGHTGDIAVDDTSIYWVDDTSIKRISKELPTAPL